MKIAVTGGAGFIGSHIVDEYIKLGHEIVVIDNLSTGKKENINPVAQFVEMDINDKSLINLFKEEKFDLINHHAAQVDVRTSVRDPFYDANTNVLGSLNVYEACRIAGIKKIIFASSGGTVYGEQTSHPAPEDHPLNPCSPYGITKLINEKYLFYYKELHGIEYVALRYGNVYGPRQNPHGEAGVVAIFLERMFTGKQPVINGDGKNTRDYIYVSDIVRTNVHALETKANGVYNVGTAAEIDVNTVFRILKEQIGSDCPEEHGPSKTGEQRRSVISYKRLHEEFGWEPEFEFEKGLIPTVDFFRKKYSE